MSKTYLAHKSDDGRTQTVLEHLCGTAKLAEKFAESFGAGKSGYLAGMLHDIGKFSAEFQKRLDGDPVKVDHSTAGALECFKMNQVSASFSIMGHHSGLPDGGSQLDIGKTFCGRINSGLHGELPDYTAWENEVILPDAAAQESQPTAQEEILDKAFFIRMLYSCLVDADYLDTECFMDNAPRSSDSTAMEDLWQRLQKYIEPWFPPKNELNAKRCAILEQCINEGKKRENGLFTLTVPTGGGKTVASLAFAIAHAKKSGLKRIIYVIPYTSIVEQTADVFSSILGEENVLEHHSGVIFDIDREADPQKVRRMKAVENWDMPVIVTTAVQFFESLYANRSSKCRKLHNIAQSVIIFDEAQMIPLPYLTPCVFAISQLIKHYGASAVLCTATQPALGPAFRKFLPTAEIVELCPPEICRYEDFRRTSFRTAGELSVSELGAQINSCEQVLCIVNSRKSAQELFNTLESDGSFHLSTLMCPEHRRSQLKEIRSRLKDGKTCRVVSTSLIEAGVDVDFPLVYRELAGLDSILQAAGRCNREGKRNAEDSIVTVFRSEHAPPPLFRTAIDVCRGIMDSYDDIASPEAIHAYFTELLDVKGVDAQDQQGIIKTMKTELFAFQTIAEKFHLIDSDTRAVYIPWNEEAALLIDKVTDGFGSKAVFRKLQRYSVNIYAKHFDELLRAGAIECSESGIAVLTDRSLYSESTGLSLHADSGQALFI